MNFGDNYQLSSLYTYSTENKIFVSSESEDDAWYKGTTYKYDQGLMTDAEVEKAYGEFSRRDVVEEIITDSTTDQLSENNLTQLSPQTVTRAGNTTYVKGRLYWTTSTNVVMPLKNTRVDLYDDEPIGGVYLQQTYTDSNGNYSFSFQNPDGFFDFENGGYDVFIRWYPDSYTFQIARDWLLPNLTYYYCESSVVKNVSSGSTTQFNLKVLYDEDNMNNRAFYVAQGMVVGQQFSRSMGLYTDRFLNVIYPFTNDNNAFCWNQYAGIGKPYFSDFDTIIHEYGHFVEGALGTYGSNLFDIILYNPNHSSHTDHFVDKNSKRFAMDLTWSEAWATAFSQIAQNYYLSVYKNKVSGFGDITDGRNYERYTYVSASGEAQEDAVIAFLWDLYDSKTAPSLTESYDNISLGYSLWWNVTTKNKASTLTEFAKVIESHYPQYRSEIGELLGAHQIAPSDLRIKNSSNVSVSTPPQLSWKVNGSNANPNDRFQIVFYDSLGNQKYVTATINSAKKNNELFEYSISTADWSNVISQFSGTATINIAVKGFHARLSPLSGPYVSKYAPITVATPNKELRITANNRYTEEIMSLNKGEYRDYILTFATSGNRLIQTFGAKDTYLYLYNANGTQISYDDDDGYGTNALLSYNFLANTKYRIRIKFYSSSTAGDIKLAIIPTASYNTYENIYNGPVNWSGHSGSLKLNSVDVFRYSPSTNRTINLKMDASFDTYLYIIDPRSAEPISPNFSKPSCYNDDGAGNLQAKITKTLTANAPYLIIASAYNPSSLSGSYHMGF